MQKLSTNLYNLDIFSLRTGHPVGLASRPLINPNNLKIEAWFAESKFENGLHLLPAGEIREIGRQGIAINDRDAITPAEDLIRLAPYIKLDFQLIGKKVYNESKQRIGKVTDYSTDLESLFIQRLYVSPAILKQITQDQKVISRTQIIEITDKAIVVRDTTVQEPNFFRAPRPAQAPEA